MSIAYFDTSAIIKLIRIELASESLRTWLGAPDRSDLAWVSSALVLTEVPRALRRIAPGSPLPDLSRRGRTGCSSIRAGADKGDRLSPAMVEQALVVVARHHSTSDGLAELMSDAYAWQVQDTCAPYLARRLTSAHCVSLAKVG